MSDDIPSLEITSQEVIETFMTIRISLHDLELILDDVEGTTLFADGDAWKFYKKLAIAAGRPDPQMVADGITGR